MPRRGPPCSPGRLALVLAVAAALCLSIHVTASAQTRGHSRYGGTLVVGMGQGDPGSLDPTLSRTFSAFEVFTTICEKLYDLDGKVHIVPQLAAALPTISKDKLTYTIPLRKGIVFNDGTPFDAQAVVTTLQRDMTVPGPRSSEFTSIDGITPADPYTVVIHLKAPYTPLPAVLALTSGIVMSPTQLEKLGDRFATNPICVGPFMYDSRVAGDSVTVIKSPWYYDRTAVHLDKVVFKVINDAATAAAALKSGDIQAFDTLSPLELDGVQGSSSLRVLQQQSLGFVDVSVHIGDRSAATKPPYPNVGTALASSAVLRKAFDEAIDRNALARVVFGGNVLPACTPFSPASPWHDGTLECTPYDPPDARKLVAASGIQHPAVHLLTPSTTDLLRVAQFIQAEEGAVGIDVVIDSTDPTTANTQAGTGNHDAYLGTWSTRPDPDQTMFDLWASSGSRNSGGYSNPRLDLILANGRKALTQRARRTLYHAAQRIVLDDRPAIFLYHPIRFGVFSTNLRGVELAKDLTLRVAFAQLA